MKRKHTSRGKRKRDRSFLLLSLAIPFFWDAIYAINRHETARRLDRIRFAQQSVYICVNVYVCVYGIAWRTNLYAQEILFILLGGTSRGHLARVRKTVCFFSFSLSLSCPPLNPRSTARWPRQRAATTTGHVFSDVY